MGPLILATDNLVENSYYNKHFNTVIATEFSKMQV